MTENTPVVPKAYRMIFILLVSCFALWGLLNNMTDHLVPAFQLIFDLPQSTAVFVQVSFYGSYSVIALFASYLIQKKGYRCGVLCGLGVYIIGALIYVPACVAQSFWLYIAGIFVVAGGCAVLETTCNPYILALGDPSTSVRRLNLAQMFNPVGSIAGILLAQQVILKNLDKSDIVTRRAMEAEQLKSVVHHDLFWVCVPYVGLCIIALAIWLFFFRSKASEVDVVEEEKTDYKAIFLILARSPKWYLGVVAQVFYVGVQIAAWTYINLYGQYEFGLSKEMAANYYLLSILMFIICRCVATFCMKYVDPARLMALFAFGAIVCTAGVMYLQTPAADQMLFSIGGLPFSLNVICFVLMSGCMSLMFPTIYGIALGGIDKRAHKAGAAGLIMAIVGGAILTYWMAAIISSTDSVWLNLIPDAFTREVNADLGTSAASLRASFVVPAICFAVVLGYALLFARKRR